jgi:hypothetical protein
MVKNIAKNQAGRVSVLIFPLIFVILLLIGAVSFAAWAFTGRQDFKNNVDQKVAVAVNNALKVEDAKKDAQFSQDYKKPLKQYTGPSAYGSLKLQYPKTWSAYIDETDNGATGLNGYFYPDFVPTLNNPANSYALRVQVVNQTYATVLKTLSGYVLSQRSVITPYSLPSLKNVVGSRVEGIVISGKVGSMVLLPLRDKTLELWTEAAQFDDDFNNIILANASFSP